ncbi:MAG: response regulator transcription factor [Bacteroidota bacterium]
MIKILLADDHAVVRQGLKQMLMETYPHAIFAEASNAAEVMALVHKQRWDIAILDISMPGRNGLDVLKEIKDLYPKLPVLILSMHPEDQFAVRVIKAGAAGYMMKDTATEELITAIKKILAGGKYIRSSVAEKLAEDMDRHKSDEPHKILSDREYQVLCMMASGKTVSDIAHEMALSVKTISTYRARILDKMKMKSNAELTHYAIKNNLVE